MEFGRKLRFGQWRDILLPDPVKQLVEDETSANVIRGQQIEALSKSSLIMLSVTILNVLLTVIVLFSTADPVVLGIWALVSLGFLGLGLKAIVSRRKAQIGFRPTRSTDKAVHNATFLGLIWALMPVLFFHDASTAQKVFITSMTAGMLGGGAVALGILPAAASAMSLVIAAGAVVALFTSGNPVLWLTEILLVNYAISVIRTIQGNGVRFVESRLNEMEIRKSNETIGVLLNEFESTSSDWMWETNDRGYIVNPSKRFADASVRSATELRTLKMYELARELPIDEHRQSQSVGTVLMSAYFDKKQQFQEVVIQVKCGGVNRWWSISGGPIWGEDGSFTGFRGVASDISERKEAEIKLSRLARFDHLTQLANRTEFTERLNSEISSLRSGGHVLAVLYIDLDKFKPINDTLGHTVGDGLLRAAAYRIAETAGTRALTSRFGGDEFLVCMRCPESVDDACAMSASIIEALEKPFEINGHKLSISGTIGIAMCNSSRENSATLIHNADLALYRAKNEGRGGYKLFAEHMDLAARERRELEIELRSAVANEQLVLFYQPLANIENGEVIGFEALLRWNNPKRGEIPPNKFISLAEGTGLIHEIGDWVIMKACQDAKTWPGNQKVSINLSGKQLHSFRIVEKVINALAATGLSPSRLEFEVTESVLLGEPDVTLKLLGHLRELGVQIALDDFGTGYSSLSYLVKFPFDKIKIDKSFIQSASSSSKDLAIVRSILSLAKDLNITTLAEGIETKEQYELLRSEGCEQIQGFILDRPQPMERMREFERYPVSPNDLEQAEQRSKNNLADSQLTQLNVDQRLA